MARGITFRVDIELVTEECIRCGMAFGVPSNVIGWRKRDHQSFYCPAGHAQIFSDESAEERLKRELREAEERHRQILAVETRRRARAESDAMDLANSNRALKEAATKLKKRAAAGVCPACHRTISQMARHMATKHPSYSCPPDAQAILEREG